MTVHRLHTAPPGELAEALARFETQFTYPLGPGRYFRISHGDDYPRFFRAIGESVCFIAERQGEILGTIGAGIRPLLVPEGRDREVLYLGDLKVAPAARGGRCLLDLAQAVQGWAASRVDGAFSVVMDGTPATPLRYTGRFGIPSFRELGKIVVLRLATRPLAKAQEDSWQATGELGAVCYRRLSSDRYASIGGNPEERSEMEPLWLMEPDGLACGRLEDTRRAKRLIADDGLEMRSAHLSCFAFENPRAGKDLLETALSLAGKMGFPALFASVADSDAAAICRAMEGNEMVFAPATIYGTGIEPCPLWNINTAEI